jgi:hypothetical protein
MIFLVLIANPKSARTIYLSFSSFLTNMLSGFMSLCIKPYECTCLIVSSNFFMIIVFCIRFSYCSSFFIICVNVPPCYNSITKYIELTPSYTSKILIILSCSNYLVTLTSSCTSSFFKF